MSSVEQRKLERVRYWQGQKLRSRDFNNIHAVEEQRRWWHNRALHNAYGIEEGFEASLSTDNTGVVIQAGLAYDNAGRELILETEQTVTIPYTPGMDQDIVLCIRYRQEIQAPGENDLATVCCTSTGPQFVEFVWRPKQHCGSTDGVPLAEIVKGQLQPLSTRPSARPLSRPLLASGSTVPGNTAWELWSTETGRQGVLVFGVQTTIDTSAAGFTDDPCYFAWLQGPVWSPQTQEFLPALYPSIAEQTLNSFVFRIALLPDPQIVPSLLMAGPTVNKVGPDEFALFAHKQNLYVNWVGCQKNASAPFLAVLQRIPRFVLDLTLLQTVLFRLNRL